MVDNHHGPFMQPDDQPKNPASIGYALAIGLLVLVAAGKPVLMDTLDPDCFWHLRVAEQLLQQGVGPIVDDLSFQSIKEPWTPYSWLAELGMLGLWKTGGWRATVAVHALMSAAFITLIAMCCRELQLTRRPDDDAPDRSGELNAVLATAAACVWSLAYLSFRPATLAIALVALAAWLIFRDRRLGERTRAVWGVIPLAALTTNIHLTVIVLPLWLAACAAGALWEWRRNGRPETANELRRRFTRYATLACLIALACLATPMLPGVIRILSFLQFDDVMIASPIIAEMRPFHDGIAGKISLALVLLTLPAVLMNRRRLRTGEMLWLAGMLVFLLKFGRFAPLFAIIAAPVAAVVWPRLSDRALRRKPIVAALGLIVVIGGWRVAGNFPAPVASLDTWLNRHAPDASSYPTSAAEFVETQLHPDNGRLINEFSWGGYLAWRLGDRYQVLMDGRTQMYTREFWTATYLGTPASRRTVMQECDGDVAIVPRHRSLFAGVLRDLGWTVAWRDEQSQVLVPPETRPRDRAYTKTD